MAAIWNLSSFASVFFWFAVILGVLWAIVWLFSWRRSSRTERLHRHYWRQCEFADKPTYCNGCSNYCADGGKRCDACGACVCLQQDCLDTASRSLTCKKRTTTDLKMFHHWTKGNLPLLSKCFVCTSTCGSTPCLADYRCVWCGVTVHEDCLTEIEHEQCDSGPHSSMIIPPNCIVMKKDGGWRRRKKWVVKELRRPLKKRNWQPMLVLANPKSGGKDGEMVIGLLRGLLNPVQVIDVLETSPEEALKICHLVPDVRFSVLVCGGDGTVGWVLRAIEQANLKSPPNVGLLPLGTGNDLARVLGWGSGYIGGEDEEEMVRVLTALRNAKPRLLDRWDVKVVQPRKYLHIQRMKRLAMSNYLGVGCGAGVTLMVHQQRETKPHLFPSRLINKAWYVVFGAKDVIEKSCSDLHNKIEVYLDGRHHPLPDLEGVVVLNINCWSSGCVMWPDTPEEEHLTSSRMDDQLLEVVGIYSSIHVGKIQVAVEEPLRIGQAKAITIKIHESVPVQVDGEPWLQSPSTITITHLGHAHMLSNITESSDE